jgi:hypothetical protein
VPQKTTAGCFPKNDALDSALTDPPAFIGVAVLDPVSALAFEMHASKGIFALLLGSGLSRAAKIPTGWEITLELVKRVAALNGADTSGDPAAWYKAETGEDPDYSKLLDSLATTPAQRQQVIKPFIEPSEAEIDRGEKRPTAAHRSIAQMMAKGYVRVVVTPNFDRLLEQALADIGVHATVLSSADHVAGAMPLTHSGPTVIKIHGDYLDTRIRNTFAELSGYAPELNVMLDRVFDEYGLVVCGWSADWDLALKAAIDRAPSRRFPLYWASRGAPSASAMSLIQRRAGKIIEIVAADDFFDQLEQKTRALESMSRPHPLSTEMAVALLKEYLPEPRHQIRLHDLLVGERNRTLDLLASQTFDTNNWDPAVFSEQAQRYEGALSTLLPLAYYAGIWSQGEQSRIWADTIVEFASRGRNVSGVTVLVDLIAYPASLILHAYLLGTVVGKRPEQFGSVATYRADFGNVGGFALGDRLNASTLVSDGGQGRFKSIPALAQRNFAASDQIANVLRPISLNELRSGSAFDDAFARVEVALSLGFAERLAADRKGDDFWSPVGRFCYQGEVRSRIFDEWQADYAKRGSASFPSVMAGLDDAPRFEDLKRLARRSGFYG